MNDDFKAQLWRTFKRLSDEALHAGANPDYYWRCVKLNAMIRAMEIARLLPRTEQYYKQLEKKDAA